MLQIGSYLVGYFIVPVLLMNIQLLAGIPVSNPAGFILGVLFVGVFSLKEYYKGGIIAFVIFLGACCFEGYLMDFSYDGQAYHQLGVLMLADGWNPFWDGEIFQKPSSLWVYTYPRIVELWSAGIYSVSKNIMAGKACLLMLAITATLWGYRFLQKTGLTLVKWQTIIFAFLAAFNPIVVCQLNTYYIDGFLYILFLLIIYDIYIIFDQEKEEKTVYYELLLIGLIAALCNTKFTGAVYAVVLVIAIIVIAYLNIGGLIKIRQKLVLLCTISLMIGVFFWGFNPYMTNLYRHGHVFYPLMGNKPVDIITAHGHPDFLKHNRVIKLIWANISECNNAVGYDKEEVCEKEGLPKIKLPGIIRKNEIKCLYAYSTHIGGFGVWFNIILVCSVILLIYGLCKRCFSCNELTVLFLLLVSVLINPECWWARYSPQFYLFPLLIFVLAVKKDIIWSNYFKTGIIVVMLINVGLLFAGTFGAQIKHQIQWHEDVKQMREYVEKTHKPVPVDFSGMETGKVARFERYGIPYREIKREKMSSQGKRLTDSVEGIYVFLDF